MKYYVLGIWGDVEPNLSEQFDTEEDRDADALRMKQENTMDDGGIYRLNIDDKGNPIVDSYGYLELHPEEDPGDDVADGDYREDAFKND
jgi:hypothetical protein